jgi:hypothetical protein
VPGTAVVTDKGLAGEETEEFFAGPDLGLILIRPARKTPRGLTCQIELVRGCLR